MLKKLPLGRQTFSEIITDGFLYIDKTRDIFNLLDTGGKYFFLSRPRRFGKSLLVSTLKEIFEGNRNLFKNLYIYDKIEWHKHPVIHVDFTNIDYSDEIELQRSLLKFLHSINDSHDLKVEKSGFKSYFGEIIASLSKKYNSKVVVLIDEYDKPIIDYITEVKKATENREVLRDFYSILKSSDRFIRFALITGISKFSQVSIFSTLNNLDDITLDKRYATILGITDNELVSYFNGYIDNLAKIERKTRQETLSQIKTWYNGYSWDGLTTLYNPLSLLKLFSKNSFDNYWFATGTPTFLIKLLKENNIPIPEIENLTSTETIFNSFDIDNLEITALLFQTGYVTIKSIEYVENQNRLYHLAYPNFEVKQSLSTYLLASFINAKISKIEPLYINMSKALRNSDIVTFINLLRSMLAGIPYTIKQENESYYHTIFYITASLLGAKMDSEVLTNQGRIDGVIEFSDTIYIIEFKYRKEVNDIHALTEIALTQIKNKKYHEKYIGSHKKIYLLGVAFIDNEVGYKLEEIKK